MTTPKDSNIRDTLRKRRLEHEQKQREMLSNPSPREQELLDSLSRLENPITKFQEEWLHEVFSDVGRLFRNAALDQTKESLGVGEPDTELDRFQIATIRLIDTIHGYFAGDHAVTLFDNARAACEVISGFTKALQQRGGLLPQDIPLIYKSDKEIGEDADKHTLISAEMHKVSRQRSNASKHANKDARKVYSYSDTMNLSHLMFSMVQDYETLHCALLKAGLLDTDTERLYPIKRAWLVTNARQYRNIYHSAYSGSNAAIDDGSIASTLTKLNYQFDEQEINVPAATVACLLFHREGMMRPYDYEANNPVLETMSKLRIWPISISTHARAVRDPNVLNLNSTPAP
ncbi:MAG: hypothetical protein ACRBCT_04680 [Alphaproteobacteria bacterium]